MAAVYTKQVKPDFQAHKRRPPDVRRIPRMKSTQPVSTNTQQSGQDHCVLGNHGHPTGGHAGRGK